jgi:hypothetical protein
MVIEGDQAQDQQDSQTGKGERPSYNDQPAKNEHVRQQAANIETEERTRRYSALVQCASRRGGHAR